MDNNSIYACIDLGSNMCRLLIAKRDISNENGFVVLESLSSLIALGSNPNKISKNGFYRIGKALRKCCEILMKFKHIKIDCIATAIFRSADNSEDILNKIYSQFGLRFRICLPDEEIMFSGYGSSHLINNSQVLIMDMGGGSTEIGLFTKNTDMILNSYLSLPYGLFYFSTKTGLPTDSHKILIKFSLDIKYNNKNIDSFVLVRSGIMSTIAIYLKQQYKTTINEIMNKKIKSNIIKNAIQQIIKMTNNEIIMLRLVTNFSYISSIKNSLLFFNAIINYFSIDTIILSNYGVREGIIKMAFNDINFNINLSQ